MTWFYLALAIVAETAATSALVASAGFTKWIYGGLSLGGIALIVAGVIVLNTMSNSLVR